MKRRPSRPAFSWPSPTEARAIRASNAARNLRQAMEVTPEVDEGEPTKIARSIADIEEFHIGTELPHAARQVTAHLAHGAHPQNPIGSLACGSLGGAADQFLDRWNKR